MTILRSPSVTQVVSLYFLLFLLLNISLLDSILISLDLAILHNRNIWKFSLSPTSSPCLMIEEEVFFKIPCNNCARVVFPVLCHSHQVPESVWLITNRNLLAYNSGAVKPKIQLKACVLCHCRGEGKGTGWR